MDGICHLCLEISLRHWMECMAQKLVFLEDIFCYIVDMIGPEVSPLFIFLHVWLFNSLLLNSIACGNHPNFCKMKDISHYEM